MSTIFLTENLSEGTTKYFAIDSAKIETLNVSDTYDQYGQNVSASDAGDSIELLSNSAVSIANGESENDQNNGYEIGNIISAYDNGATFDLILDDKLLKEGVDYNSYKETVKGFTYWDGHNWKTVTTQVENGEPTHEIVTDETLIAELNKAIEEKELEGEGFGRKIYKGNGFVIVDSFWEGTWSEYEIVPEDEYEMEQEQNSSKDFLNS